MSDAHDAALAELARCRDEIARIDRAMLDLLAERVRIGRRVGELKRTAGLPVLDPKREAEVVRAITTAARELALPSEPVRDIFWHVIGLSRRVQDTLADADGGDGTAPTNER